ncbi:MAG: MBL fold metallo-hydrolase [Chloroflexota bacterium]|nr:MBL fold metallo-hydrolase [Chloroflexota bacterium]
MALTIRSFVAGPLETNAYLVADDATGEAIAVDAPPGVTADLTAVAEAAGLRIGQVVITHAHWDHIADAAPLAAATGAPLVAHPLAVDRMETSARQPGLPVEISSARPDRLLDDGDEVRVGGVAFRVLHLPGHDPAHIVLYAEAERTLLGGDVLFPGGHGTTEVPGADQAAMDRSLVRLAALPPDVTVYPGHGRSTTIGAEASWLPGTGKPTE